MLTLKTGLLEADLVDSEFFLGLPLPFLAFFSVRSEC